MELMLASALGVVTAAGVYLLLRARTFCVILGLSLLSYATNVFIFVMGRLEIGAPPLIDAAATHYSDPLPQALVLTAIVIGFGMTAFLAGLAVRAHHETGTDHVDGGKTQEGDECVRQVRQ